MCAYILFVILNIIFVTFTRSERPNILLLVVDDLRPTLGCYGDAFAITPNIDKIAKEGIVFTNAFAQQALCGPSRTSFLTSRRPDTTKLIDTHYYWRHHAGNFTTLPQYFKEHGYETQSIGKIFHPGIASGHNDDQPYSWSLPPYHPPTHKYKNSPLCLSKDGRLHTNIYCPVSMRDLPGKTLPDVQSAEFSLNWLRRRAEDQRTGSSDQLKPFFLAVGFHKPHIPLKFPMDFLDLYRLDSVPLAKNRYRPKNVPVVAWNPWNDLRWRDDIAALNLSFPFGPMPDLYSRYLRQGYYAATSYMDSLVGAVVSETKRIFPHTIVVLIGDHGWSLGEHQEWSKFSNYEVATKVPFIISTPLKTEDHVANFARRNVTKSRKLSLSSKYFKKYVKLVKKKMKVGELKAVRNQFVRYSSVVELVDLFPTLVDLTGLPRVPSCPRNSAGVKVCSEGISLHCRVTKLRDGPLKTRSCPAKKAAMSQYPRPSGTPSVDPDTDQPRLTETNVMGYSLRTNRYRYTSWLKFNHTTFTIDGGGCYGEELYDHLSDAEENHNLIYEEGKRKVLGKMRTLLKEHLS